MHLSDETLIALSKGLFKNPQNRLPELRKYYQRIVDELLKTA
jgi:hypothetical protein